MNRPHISIVGLGPGDHAWVTDHTRREIDRVARRFVRTVRHPSADLVTDAESFDAIYDDAATFDDVYARIVERLVEAANESGEILYAVPGSPLVLERTVRSLLDDGRLACTVHPAMSFLDLAWARLGIDPVERRVTLVDGHRFAVDAAGLAGPLLIAHTHADWVLSEIKLAAESASGDEPVVILQHLGTADERIVHSTWADLDRTVAADHLTCVFVESLGAPVAGEVARFHELTRILRRECPWDREQSHASLVRYLIEETYEVVDALHDLDPDDPATDDHLVEELGDLLYQIEFHAAIAEEQGRFTMADVARGVHDKLVRRHPHVFGDTVADDADTVRANWEAIKRHERGDDRAASVFDRVPDALPALGYADAVQKAAAGVGFDWPDVEGAWAKVPEESAEVRAAVASGDHDQVAHEVGDLLFAVVNVARHVGVDPEAALRRASQKFRRRFASVEEIATRRAIDLRRADLAELDRLWDEVKAAEG
ncbi:MAG: nucleoside triphosphate pyrophosphohydrolase [Ilumatobacteraceae bacterium]